MVTFEIIFIVLLIFLNGVLVLSELAVVSSSKPRLRREAEEGNERARKALNLAENPEEFLATVQIEITVVGILTGVFGGATISEEISLFLQKVPILAPFAGPLSIFLVVLTITFFTVIFGELFPKRLALYKPEKLAMWASTYVWFLSRCARPLVWLMDRSVEIVAAIFSLNNVSKTFSDEDVALAIEEGARTGAVEKGEEEILRSALGLGKRGIASIMTPRTDIIYVRMDATVAENWNTVKDHYHSYFPVLDFDNEHVKGVVAAKDLARLIVEGHANPPESIVKPVLEVGEFSTVLKVLELFREKKTNLAAVIDEHGSFSGIATISDVMRSLIGEIQEHSDTPSIVERPDGSLLIDAWLGIDEVLERLDAEQRPAEERGLYHSVAGFALERMGRIPNVGERFSWDEWEFEIIDLDGKRIDKILATPKPALTEEAADGVEEDG